MQISQNLLRVIFMLSTIVAVTDCCSSRILLMREHTLKIVNQHKYQNQDDLAVDSHQQEPQKWPDGIDFASEFEDFSRHFFNTATGSRNKAESSIEPEEVLAQPDIENETGKDELLVQSSSSTISPTDEVNASSFITDSTTIRHQQQQQQTTGNAKYDVIDFYYKIMRDVLSFECKGEYLTDFCLNGGRCFRYPLGNQSLFSCECADGYVGERCESKSLNELYVRPPALEIKQPKIRMARIVFSFPMLIAISVIYILFGAIIVFKCPNKNRSAGMIEGRRLRKLDSYTD